MNANKTIILSGLLVSAMLCGCQGAIEPMDRSYQTVGLDPQRDTELASKHNAQGVALLDADDLTGAEVEFKAALTADTMFAPAHNNLGTVYYKQKKFYLAAWEFQYAAKLMPDKPGPRNNLGLVYEAVGKLDDAAKAYQEALDMSPDAFEFSGNLARVYVRDGRKDAKTRKLLNEIVLKDSRPEWVAWAKENLITICTDEPPVAESGE